MGVNANLARRTRHTNTDTILGREWREEADVGYGGGKRPSKQLAMMGYPEKDLIRPITITTIELAIGHPRIVYESSSVLGLKLWMMLPRCRTSSSQTWGGKLGPGENVSGCHKKA